MANIKSAKKRVLVAERNRLRNVAFKTSIKTAVKKVLELAKGEDMIFFGNLTHNSGSVKHSGDNLTGLGDGVDESIFIELDKVDKLYI